jgi:ribosomal protein S27AE
MFDDEEALKCSRRKCLRCGEIVEMADHWWEFISFNCEPCTDLEFAEWQKKSEARYVNPPEGEAY